MLERYLQAAQQILDRAIVTPRLSKTFTAGELKVTASGAGGRGESAVAVPLAFDPKMTICSTSPGNRWASMRR